MQACRLQRHGVSRGTLRAPSVMRSLVPVLRPCVPQRRCSGQACHAHKASELPPSMQKIVGSFQMVPDPMARYKQLLFYAAKLPPMAAVDHTPGNKVEGCVSQVWVKPELRDNGKVYWSADSDSQLTKGLAALLVLGLSDCTPEQIIKVDPGFIEALGLKQSLTPSRNNGFLNMLRLMQRKALELIGDGPGAQEGAAGSLNNIVEGVESVTGATGASLLGEGSSIDEALQGDQEQVRAVPEPVPVLAQVAAGGGAGSLGGASLGVGPASTSFPAASAGSSLRGPTASLAPAASASASAGHVTPAGGGGGGSHNPGAPHAARPTPSPPGAAPLAAAAAALGMMGLERGTGGLTIGGGGQGGASAGAAGGMPVGVMLSSEEVQERMKRKLTEALQPSSLSILDESPEPKQSRQALQLGLPPPPKELHFRLEIVSPEFEGMNKVKRQRRVYQIVAEEFNLGLHALALVTKAPGEV